VSESVRKPIRAGIIAAIVAFSVIAGTVGSYAYWSATANATLGAGAATLSSTATGWTATTLGNEDVVAAGSASLTSTGSITFTNTTNTTSTQAQTLTATFSSASGDATLAAGTTLTAWYVASAASCTAAAVPVSPVTGTWAAGVVASRSLLPGATATYCLRNTISDRQSVADTDGTRSFVPQAVAQLSIGNFTGGATATSTISSEYIFPMQMISAGYWNYIKRATTEWCWDVSGSGTGSGSLLISYACKPIGTADLNQDFRFMDANGDGYGDIQARHAPAIRVAAAASTASGSSVTMITTSAADTQQWQAQLVSAGTYQFVNKYSGLCLSMPAVSTGPATQVTCSGGADQKFTFTTRVVIQLQSFLCTNFGGSGSGRSVEYDWTSDHSGGPYTINAKLSSSSTWTLIGTTSGTSLSFASPIGAPFTSGAGTYNVQILNANGDQVGSDSISVAGQYTWWWVDYYYARC
jgi:hypothetical protein